MMDQAAAFTSQGHKPLLIEDWLPIRELGIESVRERQAASALPPLSFLHIWWARAPLAAANGVTLASLLPVWSDDLLAISGMQKALDGVRSNRKDLRDAAMAMSNSDWYRVWVLWVAGIWGDPVEAMRIASARMEKPSFAWPQAYKNKLATKDLNVLHRLLIHQWGRLPRVLDPTAGGGSIPYTSLRYGLPTWANDLNPVAVGVLDATLKSPSTIGTAILPALEKWGGVLVQRLRDRLDPFFQVEDSNERVASYIIANTVACPRTGGPVPLSPNWWLDKTGDGVAVRLEAVSDKAGKPNRLIFHIESGPQFVADPDSGTVARGVAISPWDGLVIDSGYIKAEAQAGRMWPTLYAVAVRRPKTTGRGTVRSFRAPTDTDLHCLLAATRELEAISSQWQSEGIIPTEEFPPPIPKHDIRPYGFLRWRDFFTDRQLLVHGAFVWEWRHLVPEVVSELGEEVGSQVLTLLSMMQSKALDYNSRLGAWDATRLKMGHVFTRHDFSFKWTYAEFEGARQLWPWCLSQLLDSYRGVSELMQPLSVEGLYESESLEHQVPGSVVVSSGSAAALPHIDDASIDFVNIDPPYYDNVMYAELSDFFYVWEKRTLGQIVETRYADELSNKDDEAIANPARFFEAGRRRNELATFDYQQKMQAIFTECSRVLVDDGVMVVWFTHKRSEAWDTLGTSMMEAGFAIEASWPVGTQPEVSMHHAGKNSAKSTIMLVCRKRRSKSDGEVFFEDIEAELRQAARSAVEKFEAEVGVGGVDLQLATYGPTLSVISRNWPVLSSEPDEKGRSRRLRPEEALDVARQEVARLRMQRLVGKDASFDAATDFWLMCWETFQAREFPFDEARKLALGVGYDVEEAIKSGLLGKKASNVELVAPTTRGRSLRRAMDDTGRLPRLVDALHLMLVTYRDDKLAAARTWLADSGYGEEQQFLDVVQAAVNAVPRVRGKKGLTVEEAILLEDAVVGLFGDEITLPVEAEEQVAAAQMTLEG